MKFKTFRKYLFSCFLLTIPILVWDLILTNKLPKSFQPEIFWNNIPSFLIYGENISRTFAFIALLFMPLNIATQTQKKGVALYVTGALLYFVSWLILISFPNSIWSNSLLGFIAPAFTPLFWLIGIALLLIPLK